MSSQSYKGVIIDNESKEVQMADKAKACVFESIFSAYKVTREAQVEELLSPLVSDKQQYKQSFNKIMKESNSCHYGKIINSPRNLNKKEYNSLAKITIPNFKSHINDCVESLSIEAGKHITRATLQTHPDLLSNIKEEQDQVVIINKIMKNDYQACIDIQNKSLLTTDPQRCRDYLTAVTTLEVSNSAIRNTIDQMYESMPTTNIDNLKEQITQKIRECEPQVKNSYKDHIANETQAKNEKVILSCMASAISKLAYQATNDTIANTLNKDKMFQEQLK